MIPDTFWTLDKAKAHLRVTHNDEDALITAMLDGAVAAIERATRRALTQRVWTVQVSACDVCGCDSWVFHAALSPATVEVAAFLADGDERPVTDFFLSSHFGTTVVHVRAWGEPFLTEGIVGKLIYTAEPTEEVPADLYAAVMLTLGDLYENREGQVVGIAVAPNPTVAKLSRAYVLDMHV